MSKRQIEAEHLYVGRHPIVIQLHAFACRLGRRCRLEYVMCGCPTSTPSLAVWASRVVYVMCDCPSCAAWQCGSVYSLLTRHWDRILATLTERFPPLPNDPQHLVDGQNFFAQLAQRLSSAHLFVIQS